jgi:hypothetical protein
VLQPMLFALLQLRLPIFPLPWLAMIRQQVSVQAACNFNSMFWNGTTMLEKVMKSYAITAVSS